MIPTFVGKTARPAWPPAWSGDFELTSGVKLAPHFYEPGFIPLVGEFILDRHSCAKPDVPGWVGPDCFRSRPSWTSDFAMPIMAGVAPKDFTASFESAPAFPALSIAVKATDSLHDVNQLRPSPHLPHIHGAVSVAFERLIHHYPTPDDPSIHHAHVSQFEMFGCIWFSFEGNKINFANPGNTGHKNAYNPPAQPICRLGPASNCTLNITTVTQVFLISQ